MKRIKNLLDEKPLYNILLIPLQVIIGYLCVYLAIFLDFTFQKVPSETEGFPLPVFAIITMVIVMFITVIVTSICTIKVVRYFILRKKEK